jgi:hypothetical protein
MRVTLVPYRSAVDARERQRSRQSKHPSRSNGGKHETEASTASSVWTVVQRATAAMYAPFGGTATVRSVRGLTLSGTHLARANLLFSPVQMLRTMRSEAVSQRAPPLAACVGLLT